MNDETTVFSQWGILCPKCKNETATDFEVRVTGWASLTAEGTSVDRDHDWDENSWLKCNVCFWQGQVHEAKPK